MLAAVFGLCEHLPCQRAMLLHSTFIANYVETISICGCTIARNIEYIRGHVIGGVVCLVHRSEAVRYARDLKQSVRTS